MFHCTEYLCVHADVNECDTENGNCEHICQNTRGSFVCSCRDGFALGTDHARCVGKKHGFLHYEVFA